MVPAKLVPVFKPSKELKAHIASGTPEARASS
jgi:nucleoid DNA-binding protein